MFFAWQLGIRIPFRGSFRGEVFQVKDKNGWLAIYHSVTEAMTESVPFAIQEREENDLVWISFAFLGRDVSICVRREFRDDALRLVRGIFQRKTYGDLDVRGRDVLDLGANVGDSAIYFALNGARRVIALELFPSTFEIAKMNVEANRLGDKILLLNEGAGSTGTVKVDARVLSSKTATIAEARGNIEVKVNSLGDLVKRFSLDEAALKINCEGCEYELVLDASDADLSHFQAVMLEYHRGSRLIAKRLMKAGFVVKTSNNIFVYNDRFPEPRCEEGYISAKR